MIKFNLVIAWAEENLLPIYHRRFGPWEEKRNPTTNTLSPRGNLQEKNVMPQAEEDFHSQESQSQNKITFRACEKPD